MTYTTVGPTAWFLNPRFIPPLSLFLRRFLASVTLLPFFIQASFFEKITLSKARIRLTPDRFPQVGFVPPLTCLFFPFSIGSFCCRVSRVSPSLSLCDNVNQWNSVNSATENSPPLVVPLEDFTSLGFLKKRFPPLPARYLLVDLFEPPCLLPSTIWMPP